MKRQLSMFDRTHERLCRAEKQAYDAYQLACKHHRGQQAAKLIWQACVRVKLQYEVRHGLISSNKAQRAA